MKRFTSENGRFEKPTPTSGPGAVLKMPGGKCSWMMNPAVRLVNAFALLLKNAPVPALETAAAISPGVGSPPRVFQTARTKPSRSVTAITLFGEICPARVVACLITFSTSKAVNCANAGEPNAMHTVASRMGRNISDIVVTGARRLHQTKAAAHQDLRPELDPARTDPAFSPPVQCSYSPLRIGLRRAFVFLAPLFAATITAADPAPSSRQEVMQGELSVQPIQPPRGPLTLQWLAPEEDVTVEEPPLPPEDFNPDPGALESREVEPPPDLFPPILPQLEDYGEEPVPRSLGLPRRGVREVDPRRTKLEYPEYPLAEEGLGYSPGDQPVPNRWFIGFGRWQRYTDPSAETPYQTGVLKRWHPYLQSVLKGDAPILGEDIFLNLSLISFSQFEARTLPVPSGVSTARPDSAEFFGRSEQLFVSNDFQIGLDLFRGETAFKPVEWAIRLLHVFNLNYVDIEEANVLDPDPRGSEGHRTSRYKNFFALQEAFFELHIRDLTHTYDFISSRFGIQPFVSDFRGFIFNDSNLGIRLFGNHDNNRLQWNVAFFDMREKDTYSDLNEFNARDQRVFIANVYRQDFFTKGYTAQLSFHASFDEASRHYDKNGFLVRPAPIGDVRDHYVQSYYLGWTGDGHIGRLNITHALYLVVGEDSHNGIAGRKVDIFGQMAALELSVDKDWLRHKISFFYASGDSDPTNGQASGFDTILDRPFFIGGPFQLLCAPGIQSRRHLGEL